MIYEREILKGEECPPEYKDNLLELLIRSNKFRDAYGRPCIVTSGFRPLKKHLSIYARKGITDHKKIPMQSNHLYCLALDLADPSGEMQAWIASNIPLMEDIGLWFENFKFTPGWVHMQIKPFASYKKGGTIFFKP